MFVHVLPMQWGGVNIEPNFLLKYSDHHALLINSVSGT